MNLERRKIYSVADLVRETGITHKHITYLLEHYGDQIHFLMDGERRRYTPEAVPALLRFWREYRKGINEDKKRDSAWHREEALERLQESTDKLSEVAATLRALQADLRNHPPHRIFYINTFPGRDLQPTRAIAVHVDKQGPRSRAALIDADIEAFGESDNVAVLNLREVIMRTFLRLEQGRAQEEEEQFSLLSSLIKRAPGE
jgi:hypothetical protein